ncbi:hypothetical protein DSCW_58770 [Desulfosarcina widdelii]|uniref:DUF4136 domain-containing protein n=1 Tax=Desulfosarcina widdelii TaxID=947919 RepID=A0A5K7ZCC3_9BACT|nr:DUF4136 domain-containing protein [Desulfosarcina widdelii]BBO78460.1 hypothetical protein DSCW_58770 [Desulfosarcina widdelii]
MQKMRITLLVATLGCFLIACGGSRFQMTPTHMEEVAAGKPISNTLIIVVVDDQEIRSIFENHFKKWLAAKGVEAIISIEVLPVQKGTQLEKSAIAEVIDRYENDSVLITHLVGFDEAEVFSRGEPEVYRTYYGFYRYSWGYSRWPVIISENVQFTLETCLYDTKSESLLWAGESQLTNPETTGKAIGKVVEAVMKELEKNELLPKTS